MSETTGASHAVARSGVGLLITAVVVVSSGSSIVLAILPGMTRGLGLSELGGSAIIAVAAAAYGLGAPLWGRRSERSGRVTTITVALVGYAVFTALFASAIMLGLREALPGSALLIVIVAVRAAGALFAGAVPGAAQAYLADTSDAEHRTRALALIGLAGGLGLVLGPAIGGVLGGIDLAAPLWASSVVATALALVIRRVVGEPRRDRAPAARARVMSTRTARPLAVIFLIFASNAVVVTVVGFLMQDRLRLDDRAASAATGGALFALGAALIIVQIAFVRRVSLPPTTFVLIGLPVLAGGAVVMSLAPTLLAFIAALFVVGAGVGIALSGAIAAATIAVGEGDQGTLGGITVLVQTAGFAVGPLVGAVLYDLEPWAPGAVAASLAITALAVATVPRPLSSNPDRRPS